MMHFLAIEAPQILLILLISLLIPLIAVVDIIRNEFSSNNKIVWLLVVIFFNLFGVLLYLIMGRSQRIK